jgi:hypothetical protein
MNAGEGAAVAQPLDLLRAAGLILNATCVWTPRCRATQGVPPMKSLPIFAIVIVGLVSACTYRHETVERPVAPAATVVATPVPASNTVVYTDPAPATATTTVYTR